MEGAKTVRYVSKDPIQNLKVRVTLWRLSVQRSRIHVTNQNAGDTGQSQEAAQGQAQAQAAQAQPQGGAAAPQQQPFPQPPPQPVYGPAGQPLPAGQGLPAYPAASQSAAGPYPPTPQPQLLPAPYPQQQAQYVEPQAQYMGVDPQQQQWQQQQTGPQPVLQAAQPVAEAALGVSAGEFGTGRRPPQQQTQHRLPSAGRQRMTVQQRLDAAAAAGGLMVAPSGSLAQSRGAVPAGVARRLERNQVAAPTAVMGLDGEMAADPFWVAAGGGDDDPAVPYRQLPQRQGRPLCEAIEDPSAGGDTEAMLRRRRQRRQQMAQHGATAGVTSDSAILEQQQQAMADPQQQQQVQQQAGAAAAAESPPQAQPQMGVAGLVIPPQIVPQVVPYGSLGTEARLAATGQPPEVPPTTPHHELPEKFKTSRVFSWQEKVYSQSEVTAAQAAAAALAATGPGQATAAGLGSPGVQQPLQPQVQPTQQQQQQAGAGAGTAVQSKRQQAFGSQSALDHKRMDPRARGSILYTFVQTDDFCVAQELGRTVTTSPYEDENVLVTKLLANPKSRAQVLSFRCMSIVADLGEETEEGAGNNKVLVSIRAYPDGSFDMCPGFSRGALRYRFEDNHGGIFEYTVDHASATEIPSLEKRTAKLERAVVARAEELRRAALKSDFEPPPAGDCTRLLMLGEIQSAADFPRDRLYIEYVVRWDPDVWELTTTINCKQPQPGIVQGVTHISRVTVYPPDPATDNTPRDVAHFAHPLELEWVSRPTAVPVPALAAGGEEGGGGLGAGGHLAPNAYPCMFFQVCTLDPHNRYTSQGYGWLALGGHHRVPGSDTHVVRTWKPLGTIRDRHAEYFVGGSPELADLAYLTTPTGFNGKILNKYGFKTESIGAIKVRLHTITQRYNPNAAALAELRRSGASPLHGRRGVSATSLGPQDPHHPHQHNLLKRNSKKDLSLKMVVERARQRLREARGTDQLPGGDVGVRPGLVSEAPTIVVHPQDTVAAEDSTVKLKVVARGLPPLTYEWYKDDRKLLVATADQPELVLVQTSLDSEGVYHCLVSNKDGAVHSSKATLTVTRAARVTRAAGPVNEVSRGIRRAPPLPRSPSPGAGGGPGPGAATGGGGASRISRLARLDAAASGRSGGATAAAAAMGGGGSVAGGSDVGGGALSPEHERCNLASAEEPSPRESATALTAPTSSSGPAGRSGGSGADIPRSGFPEAPGEMLPQLPPSRLLSVGTASPAAPVPVPPPPPSPPPPAAFRGGAPDAAGALPAAVTAAASSGFQRRLPPPRSSGGLGGGRGGTGGDVGSSSRDAGAAPAAAAAADGAISMVGEVEDVVEVTGMARQRRRMQPAPLSQAVPEPRPSQQQQQQQGPVRRNEQHEDDLEAEEID